LEFINMLIFFLKFFGDLVGQFVSEDSQAG